MLVTTDEENDEENLSDVVSSKNTPDTATTTIAAATEATTFRRRITFLLPKRLFYPNGTLAGYGHVHECGDAMNPMPGTSSLRNNMPTGKSWEAVYLLFQNNTIGTLWRWTRRTVTSRRSLARTQGLVGLTMEQARDLTAEVSVTIAFGEVRAFRRRE
ncbi:MAG: hypothetical protein OK474_05045 [Thaumarchaeota archaeon]|nr:hypothetical protein [Nitrososphaerota archaeon]